jgi:hypothetical protein
MEVSRQLHASAALYPVKEPPIGQEAGWALEPACTLCNKEESPVLAGNRHSTFYPVTRYYTY